MTKNLIRALTLTSMLLPSFGNAAENIDAGKAEKLFAAGKDAIERFDYADAVKDFTEAIRLKPDYVNAYCERAFAHCKLNEFDLAIKDSDKAIPDFRESTKHMPGYTDGLHNLGLALFYKGQYEEAIENLTNAIRSRHWPVERYHCERGKAYGANGNYDSAIDDFTIAIRLNPNDALAIYYRGLAYEKQGHDEEAKSDFEEAKKLGLNPPKKLSFKK